MVNFEKMPFILKHDSMSMFFGIEFVVSVNYTPPFRSSHKKVPIRGK
jgi:hypothetical protein